MIVCIVLNVGGERYVESKEGMNLVDGSSSTQSRQLELLLSDTI